MRLESGFGIVLNWLPIEKMTMTWQFFQVTSSSIFWRCRAFLIKFSYYSQFHVNVIAGSGVITTFVYKGLNKNPEISNTPLWVLYNICRLGRVRDTKWMLQNARITTFTVSELLMKKQRGIKIILPPQIRVKAWQYVRTQVSFSFIYSKTSSW